MANPNIVNATSILGVTGSFAVPTSSGTFLSNTAASGKVYKVNTVIFCNIVDPAGATTVSLLFFDGANSRTIISDVVLESGQSIVAISKDNPIYLNEGHTLIALCSGANEAEVVYSYEEIS